MFFICVEMQSQLLSQYSSMKRQKFITWHRDNHHLNTEHRSTQTPLSTATVGGPDLFCSETQAYNIKNHKLIEEKGRRAGRSSHWSSLVCSSSLDDLHPGWQQEVGRWTELLPLLLCRQGGYTVVSANIGLSVWQGTELALIRASWPPNQLQKLRGVFEMLVSNYAWQIYNYINNNNKSPSPSKELTS